MKFIGGYIGFIIGAVIGNAIDTPLAMIICCGGGIYLGVKIASSIIEYKEEEKKRKEEYERQRKEEEYRKYVERKKREEAILLAQKYPEATKKYFLENWGISKLKIYDYDITDDKVDRLLSYKYQYEKDELKYNSAYRRQEEQKRLQKERERIEAEQRRIRQEREREEAEKRAKESALNQISNAVRSWNKAQGILPIYNLFYYYPTTCTNVYIDSDKKQVRQLIWGFKDGRESVNYKLERVLKHFFGDSLKYLTFVCIPASNSGTNNIRYRSFSQNLCQSVSMENAFNHINIIRDKQPKHLGGNEDYDYFSLDINFFRGKTVILFDDVTTKGNSMLKMKEKLEKIGANVVCGITIGKTVHENMGTDPYELL